MSRVIEGPSLTPVEAILEAHPDVRVGLYNSSDRENRRYVASHYIVTGNLSDGRYGVVRINSSSGEMLQQEFESVMYFARYEAILNLSAIAFKDKSAVRISNNGLIVIPEDQRAPEVNSIRISTKDKGLVVETKMAEGEDEVDPEEIRFLALKGMALVDTLERFATPYERLLPYGIMSMSFEPYKHNSPVNAPGYQIDAAEDYMDLNLIQIALALPVRSAAPALAGRPFRIRDILKNIDLPRSEEAKV